MPLRQSVSTDMRSVTVTTSTADRVELYRKAKGMRLFESDPVAARLQDAKDKGFQC